MPSPLSPRLAATHAAFVSERPNGADEDVHMLPAIVDHIIDRCSKPGDVVFDPFAGFGTTLKRAIALGRRKSIGVTALNGFTSHLFGDLPIDRTFARGTEHRTNLRNNLIEVRGIHHLLHLCTRIYALTAHLPNDLFGSFVT